MEKIITIGMACMALLASISIVSAMSIENKLQTSINKINSTGENGIICGYVKDESLNPIPYAVVDIEGLTYFMECDENGYYEDELSTEWIYKLVARKDGRYKQVWTSAIIQPNETNWYNFYLPLNSNPPGKPVISGPLTGKIGEELTFSAVTTDPDGDDLFYLLECDDDKYWEWPWSGRLKSGEKAEMSYAWHIPGTYTVSVVVCDNFCIGNLLIDEYSSSESDIITLNVVSDQPSIPTITGPTSGSVGVEYEYTFISTDPDGDDVYYYIEWGDGVVTGEWLGPYTSGVEIKAWYKFSEKGTYTIRAKAIDIHHTHGDFGTLEVSMSKTRGIQYGEYFFNLLQRIFPFFQK